MKYSNTKINTKHLSLQEKVIALQNVWASKVTPEDVEAIKDMKIDWAKFGGANG